MRKLLLAAMGTCIFLPGWAPSAFDDAPAVAEADGIVEPQEICHGSDDVGSQETMLRHYGGVLHIPPNLTAEQTNAIARAVRTRYENSQGHAIWRLVPYTDVVHVYDDEPQFVTCQPGDQSPSTLGAWVYQVPAGGIGIAWQNVQPVNWSVVIANMLQALEGNE